MLDIPVALEKCNHQIRRFGSKTKKIINHIDQANALNVKLGAELEEVLELLEIERAKTREK